MAKPITLKEIFEAYYCVEPYIRTTPLMGVEQLKKPLGDYKNVFLKLENMQVTGSFKVRGALNKILALGPKGRKRGLITASGGNHGIAVAYAAKRLGAKATIYVPENIHPAKRRMMEEWGGDVIIHGKIFHYALKHALKTAKAKNIPFVHTFASPDVITGQGTLGIEIMRQLPDADILVIAIGGGGLIGGISVAAKAINKNIKIIGVEPAGAPTLYKSLQAGKPVRLASINTKAGTLAMSQTYKINYDLVEKYVDDIVLVSDKEMQTAAKWLWFEYGIAAELAGAASIAALMQNRIKAKPSAKICALVCGAGVDGIN